MLAKQKKTLKLKVGPIKNRDGTVVTNLAAATNIYFMVKEDEDDADVDAIISLTQDNMTVNSPELGWITFNDIPPSDTANIIIGKNFMGLAIKWSDTDILEINLTEDQNVIEYFMGKKSICKL